MLRTQLAHEEVQQKKAAKRAMARIRKNGVG
jgi:hypothetical protein